MATVFKAMLQVCCSSRVAAESTLLPRSALQMDLILAVCLMLPAVPCGQDAMFD